MKSSATATQQSVLASGTNTLYPCALPSRLSSLAVLFAPGPASVPVIHLVARPDSCSKIDSTSSVCLAGDSENCKDACAHEMTSPTSSVFFLGFSLDCSLVFASIVSRQKASTVRPGRSVFRSTAPGSPGKECGTPNSPLLNCQMSK